MRRARTNCVWTPSHGEPRYQTREVELTIAEFGRWSSLDARPLVTYDPHPSPNVRVIRRAVSGRVARHDHPARRAAAVDPGMAGDGVALDLAELLSHRDRDRGRGAAAPRSAAHCGDVVHDAVAVHAAVPLGARRVPDGDAALVVGRASRHLAVLGGNDPRRGRARGLGDRVIALRAPLPEEPRRIAL